MCTNLTKLTCDWHLRVSGRVFVYFIKRSNARFDPFETILLIRNSLLCAAALILNLPLNICPDISPLPNNLARGAVPICHCSHLGTFVNLIQDLNLFLEGEDNPLFCRFPPLSFPPMFWGRTPFCSGEK